MIQLKIPKLGFNVHIHDSEQANIAYVCRGR